MELEETTPVAMEIKVEKDMQVEQEPVCSSTALKVEKVEDEATNKKYVHSDVHSLSGYNKKEILNHLKTHGCNAKMFHEALRKFKVSKESASAYFQHHIDGAQANVHQESDSFCFKNANDWLEFLKARDLHNACNYESAIVMNAIAYNEKHPDPAELNGVNLAEVYEFLARSLLGMPQNELKQESALFLASEFQLLIEEANSECGDKDSKVLKDKLETASKIKSTIDNGDTECTDEKPSEPKLKTRIMSNSLDPLKVASEMFGL